MSKMLFICIPITIGTIFTKSVLHEKDDIQFGNFMHGRV